MSASTASPPPIGAGCSPTRVRLALTGWKSTSAFEHHQEKWEPVFRRDDAAIGTLMFTGIITDIGRIEAIEQRGDLRARIGSGYDLATIDLGASIACSGVCLTVVDKGEHWFAVDVSAERSEEHTSELQSLMRTSYAV